MWLPVPRRTPPRRRELGQGTYGPPAKAHGARLAPDQGGIRGLDPQGLGPRSPARKKTSEVSAWFRSPN